MTKPKRVAPGIYEFKFNGCIWWLQYIDRRWQVSSGAVSYGNFETKGAAIKFICGE